MEKSQILKSQLSRKVAESGIFWKFLRNVVLFDVFFHNYHVWMENVLQM